jgi:stress response protein SCP2
MSVYCTVATPTTKGTPLPALSHNKLLPLANTDGQPITHLRVELAKQRYPIPWRRKIWALIWGRTITSGLQLSCALGAEGVIHEDIDGIVCRTSQNKSVRHTGDNRTGRWALLQRLLRRQLWEGTESVTLNLTDIPSRTTAIVFVALAPGPGIGQTFLRLYDQTSAPNRAMAELDNYRLDPPDSHSHQAAMPLLLMRGANGVWLIRRLMWFGRQQSYQILRPRILLTLKRAPKPK